MSVYIFKKPPTFIKRNPIICDKAVYVDIDV